MKTLQRLLLFDKTSLFDISDKTSHVLLQFNRTSLLLRLFLFIKLTSWSHKTLFLLRLFLAIKLTSWSHKTSLQLNELFFTLSLLFLAPGSIKMFLAESGVDAIFGIKWIKIKFLNYKGDQSKDLQFRG